MAITKFSGETNWDAIVSDNSLTIEEEAEFAFFITQMGFTQQNSLEDLAHAYHEWEKSKRT